MTDMNLARAKDRIRPRIPQVETIGEMLADRVKRSPNTAMLRVRRSVGDGWEKLSARTVMDEVSAVACGLLSRGLGKGSVVAMLAPTSREWTILDCACALIGVVTVPIYESDSRSQIAHIFNDAHPQAAFCANEAQAALLESAGAFEVYTFEGGSLHQLAQEGQSVHTKAFKRACESVDGDDLLTIVYTSGTTGTSKGVELTHRNFTNTIYAAQFIVPELLLDSRSRLLLFLPVAHVLARWVQFGLMSSEASLGLSADIKNLVTDLQTFNPDALMVVPRVLEKVHDAAQAKARGTLSKRVFAWARRVAISHSRASEDDANSGPSRLAYVLAQKLVLGKIRAAFGSRIKLLVSGGAPLDTELGHFFRGLGVEMLEGYGLTETAGPSSINRPGGSVMGTVGTMMPGTEVSFTAEGEVLLRGPQVMRGYHGLPEATAATIDEGGWLHTGDLGYLGLQGHLVINGRAKDLIVTAGGKNVIPGPLEAELRSHPLVSQAVVVGDGKRFVSTLLTLDESALRTWLAEHKLDPMTPQQATDSKRVRKSIARVVARVNEGVSRAESIREFRLVPGDFTQENGLMTASMKVKRAAVMERFADIIEEIYA